MNIMEMLGQSAILTVLGMGVVFFFLIILVVIISQIGRFFCKKGMDTTGTVSAGETTQGTITEKNQEITAAISAGITAYKKSSLFLSGRE